MIRRKGEQGGYERFSKPGDGGGWRCGRFSSLMVILPCGVSRKGISRRDNRRGCLTARRPRFHYFIENLRDMFAMYMAERESNVI
jgi:hypothetical protein